jgi:type IV pilus assembly protein PilQ
VIAAFASFSGRTIVVGKDVTGTITAEIKNQPWDVALRAILQGQGLAAAEDAISGIITVDSYRNIASKQASEPLVTQMVAVNYAKASSLVGTIGGLLTKDCTPGSSATQSQQNTQTSCVARGAVAADTATNTLLITETPSRMPDLLAYVKNLDVRTPQVAIKAKIIFVNRTDIEELGLSYDLGTGADQFFSQLIPRIDPSTRVPVDTNGDGVPDSYGGGTPVVGDRVLLGGNALAAIANANARVVNPALKLVFSAALGKFQLTSFLDALQEVRLADLQAEPSIVTLDNRRAEILVGQEIPIRVLDLGTQGQQGAGGAQGNNVPRATVQLKEVGIILSVTPHITNNRQILLDLHAENSDAQLASSDVGFIFGKQRADNQLLVADGQTAVIGGLTVTQVTSSKSGIPLLVDLPLIGRLFGTTRTSEQKRDLLILVTPHIIDEGERTLAPRANAPAAR